MSSASLISSQSSAPHRDEWCSIYGRRVVGTTLVYILLVLVCLEPSPDFISQVVTIMVIGADGENGQGLVRDEHPIDLSTLSIPGHCLALKVKLAQAIDSHGWVQTHDIFHCMISNPCHRNLFPPSLVNPIEKFRTRGSHSCSYIDHLYGGRSDCRTRHASPGEKLPLLRRSPSPPRNPGGDGFLSRR